MVGTILNCTQRYQHINKALTRLYWEEADRQFFFYRGFFDTVSGCSSYFVVIPTDKKYNISTDKNCQELNQRGFQTKEGSKLHGLQKIFVLYVQPLEEDVTIAAMTHLITDYMVTQLI